jgi:conjugal transfer pilus assembly protein TrbC
VWATDPRSAPRAALWAALIAMSWATMAVHSAEVTQADIEAARRRQPVVTEQDLQRARNRNPMPSDDALRRVPVPAPPRIDRLPVPATVAPIDLEALARGFDTRTSPAMQRQASGPSVLVFISFAMPDAALQRLAEQASRAQATLVLRGLVDGSMVRTVTRVRSLLAGRSIAVQIDPQAFDRYTIVRTPSFVVLGDQVQPQPCASGACIPADGYALVSGDVSLDYALAHVQRAAPRFAKSAATLLRRLGR